MVHSHTKNRQDVPVRICISEEYGRAVLACPVCGNQNVHLGTTVVEQGGIALIAHGDVVQALPTDRHQHSRGSCVSLGGFCEAGHEFRYRFGFHKGSTFIELDAHEVDPMISPTVAELWRN